MTTMPLVYSTNALINKKPMKHIIPLDTLQMTSLLSMNNLTAAACCNFSQLQVSFLPLAILLTSLVPDAAN